MEKMYTKETPFLVCRAPTICKHSLFIYVSVSRSPSLTHSHHFHLAFTALHLSGLHTHDFSTYKTDCNISAVAKRRLQYIQPNSNFMCMLCAEFTCELLSHITRIRCPSVRCRFRHPRQLHGQFSHLSSAKCTERFYIASSKRSGQINKTKREKNKRENCNEQNENIFASRYCTLSLLCPRQLLFVCVCVCEGAMR